MDTVTELAIQRKYEVLTSLVKERSRRIWAATEADQLGRGGVSTVARATGLLHYPGSGISSETGTS